MNEERKRKILEKLQKKLAYSSIQWQQILIEDVKAKAQKSHLQKLEVMKRHNISLELREKQDFKLSIKETKLKKDEQILAEKEERKLQEMKI